jgi:hypothetical protein
MTEKRSFPPLREELNSTQPNSLFIGIDHSCIDKPLDTRNVLKEASAS